MTTSPTIKSNFDWHERKAFIERHAGYPQTAWMLRDAALTDLDNAERLVPVALNPNRFRQIGSLYLEIYDAMASAEKA